MAYCLGMVITLVTIAVSAYRVSRMNIVAAIRDLPAAEIDRIAREAARRLMRAYARPGG